MFVKQLYTKCLSEAAYYIESNGEAAVIDPLRDIDDYIQLAKERNAIIKYIFETHFHADFISGHVELQKATGAPIIYGPGAKTNYNIINAKDDQIFELGNLRIKAIHTPGHTLESCCYLLHDKKNNPYALFTGDTLFVGDVGRPDLSSGDLSKEALAGMLYKSLQKVVSLPDNVLVYPAHGPGSSCGKNLGKETYSTLGEQKQFNYALQAQTKEDFVKAVIEGLTNPPPYFPINARINQEGYEGMKELFTKSFCAVNIEQFKKHMQQENTIILDTRDAIKFTSGFIPSSISIGLEGRFAEWAGSLLPFNSNILLVTDNNEKAKETIIRLARVGLNNVIGYLDGGFLAWQQAGEPIDMIIDIEADELAMDIKYDDSIMLVDVRKEAEYANGHVEGATHLPLHLLNEDIHITDIDDEVHNVYVYCGGGYRSVIAASLLKKQGLHNVRNVLGGWDSIKEQKDIHIVQEIATLN